VEPLEPAPPVADFYYYQNGLSFQFFDGSFQVGCGASDIVEWAWDFGDGTTSAEQNPAHIYAAPGEYTVTLNVTDANGLRGWASHDVQATPPPPELSIFRITRDPAHFGFKVDLRWSGAEGELVELYRNSALIDIPDNDGEYRDRFRAYETYYYWYLCNRSTFVCSNVVSVDFGPNPSTAELARVTTRIGDQETVETVVIDAEQ